MILRYVCLNATYSISFLHTYSTFYLEKHAHVFFYGYLEKVYNYIVYVNVIYFLVYF